MKGSIQPLWWFSIACLLGSVALAAKKSAECSWPAGTAASSGYAAFLKEARFALSMDQQKTVESLFGQLQERNITIKPSLCKLLALADSDQLIPLSKKTALFFSHVDNIRVQNSGCFTSMLQNKKHVRNFLAQEDVSIATLAASPLLSSVTGMCNSKGAPDGERVANLFAWPCWQFDGQFNHELFRSVSSMLSGKGLPQEADVKAILAWQCWQVDGQFNLDFFRSFSSMLSSRGLPKEADVKVILSWPCWEVDGQFNHELFRSVSSIFSRKGLPKEADVKAILSWPVWQTGGQFNLNLFRSFSSMFHSKGLPKEQDVKAVLSWPAWQVNGHFNYELFRSFSGMFSSKRLPIDADVRPSCRGRFGR